MIMSTLTRMGAVMALATGLLVLGYAGISQIRKETQSVDSLQIRASLNPVVTPPEMAPVTKLASLSFVPEYSSESKSGKALPLPDTLARVRAAKKLAEAQEFAKALETLNAVVADDKNDYSVMFLKARILSWSGQHTEAERTFVTLLRRYPQDSDIAVSFAYLNFYQGKLDEAERGFSNVLAKHPQYQGARKGLLQVQAAR